MQGIALFFIVLGLCFWLLLGIEYSNFIQGETWTPVKAKVEDSTNSLPMTKFETGPVADRLNNLVATFVNWSYIKYSYMLGEGRYDDAKELGPHLTMFDMWVGPLAQRLPKGNQVDIFVNPSNPKETKVGFDVFRPFEMFFGTGSVFIVVGGIIMYLTKLIATTSSADDDLNKPIEYFDQKKRKGAS